ncbi:MAG: GspH/FimT family pseudopilin [Betaproteobacteria bacterium]|nr:GspH/FimT family pseudopilin [Betaproteobacteria bacterium]
MKRRSFSSGFTLIEVVLVLTLVALAYTMVPRLFGSGVSGAELRANARAIATGLRLTRDHAIQNKHESNLTIDMEGRTFLIGDEAQVRKLNEQVELQLFTSQADLISDKVGNIRFFADGTSNGGRITVGSGERKFSIDVDWLTGRVSITEAAGQNRG